MSDGNGRYVVTGPFETHLQDHGAGAAVTMLHGSGPGVSAWENWFGNIDQMGAGRRVLAPDMAGYGHTKYDPEADLDMRSWLQQLVDLLDALGIEKTVLVGNSFGGGLSLQMALRHPDRVAGLVLMGTPAGEFELSPALVMARSYAPSLENMRAMMLTFPVDKSLVTDEMVASRHATTLKHQHTAFFKKSTSGPKSVDGPVKVQAAPLEALATIQAPTLIIHGREDRVIPTEVGVNANRAIPNSNLIVYGNTGHWAQVERRDWFNRDVRAFLDDLNWGRA